MFSIEQLEAFCATVDTGSFSAAARQLNKVQSAISQHIMNLEIDCGTELFDRSGRYPRLTPQGRTLLPHALATLKQHKRLIESASSLSINEEQALHIAVDEGIPLENLSHALNVVSTQNPHINVEILVASSIDVIELVAAKRVTTGVVFSELDLPPSLDFESVGHVEFDLFVNHTHPLANQVASNIDQLLLHRQLLLRSRNAKVSTFQQAYSPDLWYADSYYVLLDLILKGLGWGILPTHIALPHLADGTIQRIPVEFEQLSWQANVDVIQHQSMSTQPIHKVLRTQLRHLLARSLI